MRLRQKEGMGDRSTVTGTVYITIETYHTNEHIKMCMHKVNLYIQNPRPTKPTAKFREANGQSNLKFSFTKQKCEVAEILWLQGKV